MDNREARELLLSHLATYRKWSYAELRVLVNTPGRITEVTGGSSARYTIGVEAFWDAEPGGAIRVRGCIDDGRWRALVPLCEDLLVGSDGSSIGDHHA